MLFLSSLNSCTNQAPEVPKIKPVGVVETGWVISCSDKSEAKSSAHGLPFMLFQTKAGGHFDTFVFSSNNIPPCEMWGIRDVSELMDQANVPRDDEISVVQHLDADEQFHQTWDLIKMRSLASTR
jgi:hypothetical protein